MTGRGNAQKSSQYNARECFIYVIYDYHCFFLIFLNFIFIFIFLGGSQGSLNWPLKDPPIIVTAFLKRQSAGIY